MRRAQCRVALWVVRALCGGIIVGVSGRGARCAEKLVDRWLGMGDMAGMNPEGFLEGRRSRFPRGERVSYPATCRKLAESVNIAS